MGCLTTAATLEHPIHMVPELPVESGIEDDLDRAVDGEWKHTVN